MRLRFFSSVSFILSLGTLLICTPLHAYSDVFSTAEELIEVTPVPENGAEESESCAEESVIEADSTAESVEEVVEPGETQDEVINYLDRIEITVSIKDIHGNDLSEEYKNEKFGLSFSRKKGLFESDEYAVYIGFDGRIRNADAITIPGKYSIEFMPMEEALSENFRYGAVEKQIEPSSVQFSKDMDKVEISITCVFAAFLPDPSGVTEDFTEENSLPRPTPPEVSFSQTKQQNTLSEKQKKDIKKLLGLGAASATFGTFSSIVSRIIIFVLFT